MYQVLRRCKSQDGFCWPSLHVYLVQTFDIQRSKFDINLNTSAVGNTSYLVLCTLSQLLALYFA